MALSVFLPWHFLDQVSVLSHNEAASVSQMNPYVCPIILHAAARLLFEKNIHGFLAWTFKSCAPVVLQLKKKIHPNKSPPQPLCLTAFPVSPSSPSCPPHPPCPYLPCCPLLPDSPSSLPPHPPCLLITPASLSSLEHFLSFISSTSEASHVL